MIFLTHIRSAVLEFLYVGVVLKGCILFPFIIFSVDKISSIFCLSELLKKDAVSERKYRLLYA